MEKTKKIFLAIIIVFAISAFEPNLPQSVFTPQDMLSLERCSIYDLSPDGSEIIYAVSTPRTANEKPGSAHRKYFRMKLDSRETSSLFENDFKGGSPQYSPDGAYISFTHKPGEGKTQVWAMPVNGRDMIQLTDADNGV